MIHNNRIPAATKSSRKLIVIFFFFINSPFIVLPYRSAVLEFLTQSRRREQHQERKISSRPISISTQNTIFEKLENFAKFLHRSYQIQSGPTLLSVVSTPVNEVVKSKLLIEIRSTDTIRISIYAISIHIPLHVLPLFPIYFYDIDCFRMDHSFQLPADVFYQDQKS